MVRRPKKKKAASLWPFYFGKGVGESGKQKERSHRPGNWGDSLSKKKNNMTKLSEVFVGGEGPAEGKFTIIELVRVVSLIEKPEQLDHSKK